jgi:hypothetical protein
MSLKGSNGPEVSKEEVQESQDRIIAKLPYMGGPTKSANFFFKHYFSQIMAELNQGRKIVVLCERAGSYYFDKIIVSGGYSALISSPI